MFKHKDDLMRWYVGSRKAYNGLRPDEIDRNGCYFLIDTKEILLEGTCYTDLFITYTGIRPESPSNQRFYLNLDTFEMFLHNGEDWHLLFGLPDTNMITTDPNDNTVRRVVSGEVTANYAKRMINNTVLDYAELVKMVYDRKRNRLSFRIGTYNPDSEITFTNIGNNIIFDSDKQAIYLLDAANTVISTIKLYPEHIISGTFDLIRGVLMFKFNSGQELDIPAVKVMNILNVRSSDTIYIETDKTRKLEMRIKKSKIKDNKLELKSDGLYFSYKYLMDKIASTGAGKAILIDANGNAKESNYIISDREIADYRSDRYRLVDEDKVYRAFSETLNFNPNSEVVDTVYDRDDGESISDSKANYSKALSSLYMKTLN